MHTTTDPTLLRNSVAPATETAPIATAASAPVVSRLDIKTISDQLLLDYKGALLEQIDDLRLLDHAINLEVERRLRERDAKAMLHPGFEKVELEESFTPYTVDELALREAQTILKVLGKDEEAAKLGRDVPERTETIVTPAHFEPGNVTSIKALRDKLGNTPAIGDALKRALKRQSLGFKCVIVRKKAGAK